MCGIVCVCSIHLVTPKNSAIINFWNCIHNKACINDHIVMLKSRKIKTVISHYSKCEAGFHFHSLFQLGNHTSKLRNHNTSLNLRWGFFHDNLWTECTPEKVSKTSQINVSITDLLLYYSAHPALQLATLEHILLIF